MEWLKQALELAFDFARKRMSGCVAHQIKNHDRKSNIVELEVGDWVWYYHQPEAKLKLGHGWQGPYLVIQKMSIVTYKIQLK